jgi:hypothetical protein
MVDVLRQRTKLPFCGGVVLSAAARWAAPAEIDTAAAVPAARFNTPRRDTVFGW